MITELARGLTNQAILAGCFDTEKYEQRIPRDSRKSGGYNIQTSPNDLSVLVHHATHAIKGKRMLCIGAETLGAERFIAEQLGILAMDVVYTSEGKESSDNAQTLIRNGVKVNGSGKPSGIYDLIILFGNNDFNLRRILYDHSKIDTLVACLNVNVRMENEGCRRAWFFLRANHFAILQSPHQFGEGVGLARITHKEELNAICVQGPKGLFICQPSKRSEGVPEGHTERNEAASEERPTENPIPAQVPDSRQNSIDGSVCESGNESQVEQSTQSGDNQTQAVGGTLEGPQVQEGPEQEVAPWGRKLDGTPRKRPGRSVVV